MRQHLGGTGKHLGCHSADEGVRVAVQVLRLVVLAALVWPATALIIIVGVGVSAACIAAIVAIIVFLGDTTTTLVAATALACLVVVVALWLVRTAAVSASVIATVGVVGGVGARSLKSRLGAGVAAPCVDLLKVDRLRLGCRC